ncbi:MAG: hypothetical protein J6C13_03080 [Clostridia bacterium]|nr:hypothetical protein [Clostridia bacterium]
MAEKIKKPNAFKRCCSNMGNKISNSFKYLRPLVMMQLKDKIDFSFLKNKKKTYFKLIWSILGFVALTAIIYLLFTLIVKFGIFSFLQVLNFRAFLILMTVLIAFSFVSCLINVTTTLYFAKDNPVLLTMPVKNSTIFTSKIIVCYIYELIKNVTYIWPFLIAYGLVMGLPFTYFLYSIFAILFLTLLIVMIAGLLSIPAMLITILLRRHKVIEFIILAVVVGGFIFGVIESINAIPTDIDLVRDWGKIYWQIQDILSGFASNFIVFDWLLQLLTGMSYNSFVFNPVTTTNLITFASCLGIIILCFVAVYFLSKPLFLKMASTPFEYRKHNVKRKHKNTKLHPFSSSAWQQTKRIFRSANLIYSILAVAVITPIAILLQNKIIGAMDTRLAGDYMGVAFNILIILLLVLSSNVAISSIFSREGNSAYLNKINPVPYGVPLTGKLLLNSAICCVSIIISTVVIDLFAHIGALATILLSLSLILVYLSHVLWSAELDLMNPQNRLYQTTGKAHKNPNEAKSTLIGFIMAGLFAFLSYFLMIENIGTVFVKLFFIAVVLFGIRLYLYLTKIKLYYKEK